MKFLTILIASPILVFFAFMMPVRQVEAASNNHYQASKIGVFSNHASSAHVAKRSVKSPRMKSQSGPNIVPIDNLIRRSLRVSDPSSPQ